MANNNIGEIDCDIHIRGFIREDKNNKLYIYVPELGIIGPKAAAFQDLVKEKSTMYGSPEIDYSGGGERDKVSDYPEASEEKKAVNVETAPKEMPKEPEVIPKNQPKKIGGLLSGLMNALGSEE